MTWTPKMRRMYHEIEPFLKAKHPLKGAIFARDWLKEAAATTDPAWHRESMAEAEKALEWLRRA